MHTHPLASPIAAQTTLFAPRCRIEVELRGDYACVLAAEPVAGGEVILELLGRRVRRPDRYSVQIGPRTHLAAPGDLPWDVEVARYGWRFLNHSCEPSAWLRGLELVALADIPRGGEVTFDYNTTEWDMASPFRCLCGTPSCVGEIRGYRHLGAPARDRLRPWLADHLKLRG